LANTSPAGVAADQMPSHELRRYNRDEEVPPAMTTTTTPETTLPATGGESDGDLDAALAVPPLEIAGRTFRSRLILGTGKYADMAQMVASFEAAGTEMVTVAVRRVGLGGDEPAAGHAEVLAHIDPERYLLLPNTAGCYTADEAVRYARLAREAGFNDFVKLEVIGDQETLLPDVEGLLAAARQLVGEGFSVLAYTNDDLVTALRLEQAGCAAVMPLASPIGSGLGLLNPYGIRTIKRRLEVPVIVDAGVGTASDACLTMEQGVDGILMNTALAEARDPVTMAWAMRSAVDAGRAAYLAGRMPRREVAVPSTPDRGMLA
jgi:thiazole synthase